MPTAPPRRQSRPTNKGSGDNNDGLSKQRATKDNSDIDVTQIHLEWACPAPPCTKNFWWASKPKPIKKRGLDHKLHT